MQSDQEHECTFMFIQIPNTFDINELVGKEIVPAKETLLVDNSKQRISLLPASADQQKMLASQLAVYKQNKERLELVSTKDASVHSFMRKITKRRIKASSIVKDTVIQ